jgi:hypothetical protein
MRRLVVAAVAVLLLADPADAASIDFMDYFPNWRLAPTHDLLTVDGSQRMVFSSPTGDFGPSGGTWGRSLRPCTSDWQMWTAQGLIYLGWVYFCDGASEVDWVTPPAFGPPRILDPDLGWHSDFEAALTRIPYGPDGKILTPTVSVARLAADIRRDTLPTGEPAILMTIQAWDDSEERWWFVDCIPIEGAGCGPGVRRIVILHGGSVVLDVSFARWVPR